MNKGIDIFTNENYNNINLDYPEGYLEELLKVAEQENQQLKEKIDKAIEYIEFALSEDKETPTKYEDWRLDLLEILKGEINKW